jgi:cephalosporin-C deacetylase-like acetyl esterase
MELNQSWRVGWMGFLALLWVGLPVLSAEQPAEPAPERKYKLEVTPDREDWIYAVGDPVKFRIQITSDEPVTETIVVRYRLGPEKFEPEIPLRVEVPPEGTEVDGGTLEKPGFLRLLASAQVGEKKIKGAATAAFSPEKIEPTQKEPKDFDAFWAAGKAELAKIPMDAQLTPRPERSGPNFDAFELSLATYDPEGKTPRFYGILCVPKGGGKFPAILQTPGAGVRGYKGEIWVPRDKFITLEVGIHGIPVTETGDFYKQQAEGPLRGYERRNLADRETFYYRRVYLGCQRALEYLIAHPKWDGKNLLTRGGSQGGQLAIVSAALNDKVTATAAAFPAFCDVTGYLDGRAGGWPGLFTGKVTEGDEAAQAKRDAQVKTTGYYDVVNFAKRLKVPAYFSWGFNDEVCPPTSFYAMFNGVTAPKELKVFPRSGHDLPGKGWGAYTDWTVRNAQRVK